MSVFPEKIVLTSRTTLSLNDRFTVVAQTRVPSYRQQKWKKSSGWDGYRNSYDGYRNHHYITQWNDRPPQWNKDQQLAWMDVADRMERRSVHERLGYSYAARSYSKSKARLGVSYQDHSGSYYGGSWKEREYSQWLSYDSLPYERSSSWVSLRGYRVGGRGRSRGQYRSRSYGPRVYGGYRRDGPFPRGRWRGGSGSYSGWRHPPASRKDLDDELDEYMSRTKTRLDAEIDSYMGREIVTY